MYERIVSERTYRFFDYPSTIVRIATNAVTGNLKSARGHLSDYLTNGDLSHRDSGGRSFRTIVSTTERSLPEES
jgi:hypothetical protein